MAVGGLVSPPRLQRYRASQATIQRLGGSISIGCLDKKANAWFNRRMTENAAPVELNPIALAKIRACPVPAAEDILRNRMHIARSGRAGGDMRGNTTDRARRTAKLLAEFGDGTTAPCVYCGTALTAATLTQDKIYTADQGGRYNYANLLPACINCNQRRSDATIHEFIAECQAAITQAQIHLVCEETGMTGMTGEEIINKLVEDGLFQSAKFEEE